MPKVDLYNMDGKVIGDIELSENIFGTEVNEDVLYLAVESYLANQRQGTQSTKTRTEVSGGGVKPWKQKGTGRARQGSIRAPQWIKGGIALGPKPRTYTIKLTKKVKRLALKSALSSKVIDNNVMVLDEINFSEIKTKNMVNVLNNLKLETNALIVLGDKNENVVRSAKNIPNVKTAYVNTINVYDILKYNKFIMTKEAAAKIEEVYA
ncbi:MAG: 50S ribosomal protein L4 [Clostridiales bacterium]|jgi:large subunit ribosomal protein L4|nr:50S ribosomal protein L4 [Clostridiales bacterium]